MVAQCWTWISSLLGVKMTFFLLNKLMQNVICCTKTNSSYKILLEVTVRLFDISQRSYLLLYEQEVDKNGRTQEMLVKHVKQQPDQNDYYSSPRQEHESLSFPTCSDEKLQDSPFLYHVLQPLRQCKNVNDSDTREKHVAILHVLCASVELFPLGSCWTTSAKNIIQRQQVLFHSNITTL